MNSTKTVLSGAAVFVFGILVGQINIATVAAQEAYPTDNVGIGITQLGVVPEDSMIRQIGTDGYFLQLRLATLEPGGHVARHQHDKRPGLVYTLEGSWTEGRSDGETEYPAGQEIALVEAADTDHWFYNRGDEPVTVIICDMGLAQ
ncbi:cupin domain-containing protein [Defluviimonas aestuarii]|uniref:cupin domain-containing protein n=1 Tax=Albidovulum aestuarii TaxID=1130726 RepID=UPI00249B3A8E|nr:cupin domain-containing protein [Defluviimonas aestuarii]MDI3338793.1 cupin domain-containing protein [Defluviimonas aestuarii]